MLDDGTSIRADVVVSNADPVRTLALLVAGGARAPALEAAVARWRTTSPVIKINCALVTAPDVLGRGRRPDGVPRAGGDRAQHRPHASVVRGGRPRSARARVVRALLPDRVRRVGRTAGTSHDERVRAVRAVHPRHRHVGRAARRDRRRDAGGDRPVRARRRRLRDRAAGARAARRGGAHRAHRRPHLPGRVPTRPDVGPALRAAHRGCRASTSAARPHTPEAR